MTDSLAYFQSMPTEHRDMLGWRVARGNHLPALFWPGGHLKRRPRPEAAGSVAFYKAGEDRGALASDNAVLVLPGGVLHDRAFRSLRAMCASHRVDPPSVADVLRYASVAFDVTEDTVDPVEWLDAFILERETAADKRRRATLSLLDRYARLDDDTARTVASLSEDARFESSCDPRVLVMVTHDGGVIVADLAGGSCDTFEAVTGRWRARYWATARSYLRPRRGASRDANRAR